ncbi:MAG: UbiX family flavin prenyltransferase [Acidobacteria bacterium]|nr:UbiX family flavin prenyltransferase [Acidobacteriota bacterium]
MELRPQRLVIGICGATGAIYGIRLLEVLRGLPDWETHLVISKAAERTIGWETSYTAGQVARLATVRYLVSDIGAALSSGSFHTAGMVVAPCSVKTLSAIAHGFSDNLLTRAADVTLKERRPLALVVREAPLTLAHIRNMAACAEMGVVIVPPVPAFYNHPKTIDDIVNHTVGRVLDLFSIDSGLVSRWEGMKQHPASRS